MVSTPESRRILPTSWRLRKCGESFGSASSPSPADALRRVLAAQAKLSFTYAAVGATAGTPPAGYVVDRTRIKLGEGETVFRSATAALRRWEQFDLGWVEA